MPSKFFKPEETEVTPSVENCTHVDVHHFLYSFHAAWKDGQERQFLDVFLRAVRRRKTIHESVMLANGVKNDG